MLSFSPPPLQKISLPFLSLQKVRLYVKRLDLVHPLISGNKYYKLMYNLEEAKTLGLDTILTFGGAYSNHIYATAAAAKASGLKSIGMIRGEQTLPLNPTLQFAHENGMELHYLSREIYRQKHEPHILEGLKEKFGDFFLIPEGGTNALAIKGTREILSEEDHSMDYICLGVGTGGTMAGLLATAQSHQEVLGFSSLKGNFLQGDITSLLQSHHILPQARWEIISDYHFGGYGKHKPELITFLTEFYQQTGIPLDPIYTGKMMFGLLEEIKKGRFSENSRILALHTGGLQGIAGFNQRFGLNLPSS